MPIFTSCTLQTFYVNNFYMLKLSTTVRIEQIVLSFIV